MAQPNQPKQEQPWHAAFPSPTAQLSDGSLDSITAEELRDLFTGERTEGDFLVVDVRRTDFDEPPYFIKGAINLPAHSFYQTLPSLLPILSRYRLVIFHCQSSSGRGPRCAGWLQDELNEKGVGKETSRAVVLAGGIKRWVEKYREDGEVTVKL
ncbi:hypothetical protein JCM8547_003143 [Rhodosporidiobolus lusitaniae]